MTERTKPIPATIVDKAILTIGSWLSNDDDCRYRGTSKPTTHRTLSKSLHVPNLQSVEKEALGTWLYLRDFPFR